MIRWRNLNVRRALVTLFWIGCECRYDGVSIAPYKWKTKKQTEQTENGQTELKEGQRTDNKQQEKT